MRAERDKIEAATIKGGLKPLWLCTRSGGNGCGTKVGRCADRTAQPLLPNRVARWGRRLATRGPGRESIESTISFTKEDTSPQFPAAVDRERRGGASCSQRLFFLVPLQYCPAGAYFPSRGELVPFALKLYHYASLFLVVIHRVSISWP